MSRRQRAYLAKLGSMVMAAVWAATIFLTVIVTFTGVSA